MLIEVLDLKVELGQLVQELFQTCLLAAELELEIPNLVLDAVLRGPQLVHSQVFAVQVLLSLFDLNVDLAYVELQLTQLAFEFRKAVLFVQEFLLQFFVCPPVFLKTQLQLPDFGGQFQKLLLELGFLNFQVRKEGLVFLDAALLSVDFIQNFLQLYIDLSALLLQLS